MTVTVEKGDPHHPQATALLQASQALMESLFPPEDNYYLEVDALVSPDLSFLVAKRDGTIIGTAALANKGDYGEVKSMFVSEDARGSGAADALMTGLIDEARALGLATMKLETGNVLYAAHKLYRRHGFTDCGVFGDYVEANSSIFMERVL
jgi:putative acetyltransferase